VNLYVGPIVTVSCLLLGFLLNTWWSWLRKESERREQEAAHRTEVRTHMIGVERKLVHIDEITNRATEFREYVVQTMHSLTRRLEAIEHKLDKRKRD